MKFNRRDFMELIYADSAYVDDECSDTEIGMVNRSEVLEALQEARIVLRRCRFLAGLLSERRLRDALLLEAVVLERILLRVHQKLERAEPADLAELISEIERASAAITKPPDRTYH